MVNSKKIPNYGSILNLRGGTCIGISQISSLEYKKNGD